MQYILTEEEYENLVPKSKYEKKCDEIKELQRLIMRVTKYKCIHDSKNDFIYSYCDNCLLAHFDCGKRKEFSR